MTTYHHRDGTIATEEEAVDARGCVRDGFRVRTPVMLMDGVPTVVPVTDEDKDALYDRLDERLCNAWRNPPPVDHAAMARVRDATLDGIPDPYDRYDRRVQDAWRR